MWYWFFGLSTLLLCLFVAGVYLDAAGRLHFLFSDY